MVWFKVDDSFYDHPKFLELPNAAIGLWAKSGAWCSKHLTDGTIPDTQVKRFKGTKSQVNALLSAGVWDQSQTESGAKAYRFHDWNDYNPDRESVLKEREDSAERQRKSRERKRLERGQQENVTRDSHVTGVRDSRVSHKGVSHRPDPTRPDPTYIEGKVGGETTGSRATGDEAPSPEISADVDSALDALAATAADRPHIRGVCPRHPDGDTGQACQGCAQAKREREHDAQAEKRSRQSAIDSCHWCDDRGLVEAHDHHGRPVALKCHHRETPPTYEPPEPDPEPRFDPADFLNKLRTRNTTHSPDGPPPADTGPF